MTDLSRGARVRRGGRRPGWLLLTALLVLAIAASSALVFTNRVELLKLAVILALWAAVVAAFVSVIYRRQSDVDQARARDLKLVYDLQLDREISARREYELTVESQLRRELASELRSQAADEVAALRAELAALRTNLEILFDAELSERPALETERKTVRGYSDWDREQESIRERVNRVTSVRAEELARHEDESSIIDVPEEPLVPPPREPAYETWEAARGGHWRPDDRTQPQQPSVANDWTPPEGVPVGGAEREREARGWARPEERYQPPPSRRSHRREETPPMPPQSQPEEQRPRWSASTETPRQRDSTRSWQPVSSDGQWLPPTSEPLGRHAGPAERETGRRVPARHSAESSDSDTGEPATPPPAMAPAPPPAARHRSADSSSDLDGAHSGGQSVADLLARLQTSPSAGGRRRRREE